jgi:hypothetical protein
MPSVTIDHMIALTMFLAVVLISIGAYSQIMGAATIQQQNHHVTMKAYELANSILLNPGYPAYWGVRNSLPSAFGLQDSDVGGYALSPFSLQRLVSSSQSLVYYPKTGLWYSNDSLGGGGVSLVPVNNAVNYTAAAKMLGVNGSYGFQLVITPTLNVSISETNLNPLSLKVYARGPGLTLTGATLRYFLYHAVPGGSEGPSIEALSGTNQTDSTGSAILRFPSVDGSKNAYSIVVYASLGGLRGVGYRSRQTLTNNQVIPFIEDFENRTVILAHSYDVHAFEPPVSALHFNVTFFVITQNFELRQIQLANSSEFLNSGVLNYGEGKPYLRTQIPTESEGILILAYKSGNDYGIVMMPWGINTLGFSVTFGGDPSNADWVATELRQMTVDGISYQVKLAVWNLKGRQILRYNP